MKRDEYRSILERLPIENPTPDDIAMLFPHLTAEQARRAFLLSYMVGVPCPPLHVRDVFNVVCYQPKSTSGVNGTGKKIPATLYLSNPCLEIPESEGRYARERRAEVSTYIEKAKRFAKDNWGDHLTQYSGRTTHTAFHLEDPNNPSLNTVLHVRLDRHINEIQRDFSKPRSEILNDEFQYMTIGSFDFLDWSEYTLGRPFPKRFNCARCGGGLLASECAGCGNKFRDSGYRITWDTPLSRKMVDYLLRKGHSFTVDPEISWEKERQAWVKAVHDYEVWKMERHLERIIGT